MQLLQTLGYAAMWLAALTALMVPFVALRRRARERFPWALLQSVFLVPLPWIWFVLGALATPECKDVADGWLDMFPFGRLALTPLVAWATVAMWAVEIERVGPTPPRWMVRGVVTGAVVSAVCLIQPLVYLTPEELIRTTTNDLWLVVVGGVPAYVVAWYSWRAVDLLRRTGFDARDVAVSTLAGAPCWVGAAAVTANAWQTLPQQCPDCFVVTAASQGHPAIVGEARPWLRGGRVRLANAQLIAFWRFESAWQARAPVTHSMFRRVYGRVGPVIAKRIDRPWKADVVFTLLRPCQVVAEGLRWVLEIRDPRRAGPQAP